MGERFSKELQQIEDTLLEVSNVLGNLARPGLLDLEMARQLLQAKGVEVQILAAYVKPENQKRSFIASLKPRLDSQGKQFAFTHKEWVEVGHAWGVEGDGSSWVIEPRSEEDTLKGGAIALDICEQKEVLLEMVSLVHQKMLDTSTPGSSYTGILRRM